MKKTTVPLLIIATGCGWLLSSNGVMPGVDWAWVLVLGALGILSLINGISKMSIVFGPMMLLCSILMVLMQSKKIAIDVALPVLVISLGILMLISRTVKLPQIIEASDSEEPSENNNSDNN